MRKRKTSINFPYLLGLLESDGSFHILFKKDPRMPLHYRIQPEVQWCQKNPDLLYSVQDCLHCYGIKSKYKNLPSNKRSGRAPVLKIEGIENCLKFIETTDKWSEQHKLLPLCGVKYLDFMLVKSIYSLISQGVHNTRQGRCQILDIKYALHVPAEELTELKNPFFQKPAPEGKRPLGPLYPRSVWEEKHGFTEGESKLCARQIISQVHMEYVNLAKSLLEKEDVPLHPDFVSGVIDGNGYLRAKQAPRRDQTLSICMPRGSELLLLSVSKYFKDNRPSFFKTRGSTDYKMSRKQVLTHVCLHLQKHPVLFKEQACGSFIEMGINRGLCGYL